MPRWLACLLVATVVGPWGQAMPRHVHAGVHHVRPEHEHGPAAHQHESGGHQALPSAAAPAGFPHIEAVATAGLVLTSIGACTVSGQAYGFAASLASSAWSPSSPGLRRLTLAPTDVRGHDPPSRAQCSPRAPPLTVLS